MGVLLALFGTVALLTGASADEPPGPDAAADTRERAVTLLRNGVSDPDKLRHSFAVRYTENGQELELGDGVWGPANAVGEYELYFADPQGGRPASSASSRRTPTRPSSRYD